MVATDSLVNDGGYGVTSPSSLTGHSSTCPVAQEDLNFISALTSFFLSYPYLLPAFLEDYRKHTQEGSNMSNRKANGMPDGDGLNRQDGKDMPEDRDTNLSDGKGISSPTVQLTPHCGRRHRRRAITHSRSLKHALAMENMKLNKTFERFENTYRFTLNKPTDDPDQKVGLPTVSVASSHSYERSPSNIPDPQPATYHKLLSLLTLVQELERQLDKSRDLHTMYTTILDATFTAAKITVHQLEDDNSAHKRYLGLRDLFYTLLMTNKDLPNPSPHLTDHGPLAHPVPDLKPHEPHAHENLDSELPQLLHLAKHCYSNVTTSEPLTSAEVAHLMRVLQRELLINNSVQRELIHECISPFFNEANAGAQQCRRWMWEAGIVAEWYAYFQVNADECPEAAERFGEEYLRTVGAREAVLEKIRARREKVLEVASKLRVKGCPSNMLSALDIV